MKKVLCGLVIALMMTGSGYSKEASRDTCKWLKVKAVKLIETAHAKDFVADKILKESNKRLQEPDDTTPEVQKELEYDNYKQYKKEQFTYAKDAHYYAVTWSALCD